MASDGLKALKYAEDLLGVHKVHEDALAARGHLDETLTRLSEVRNVKRDLEERLRDRELDIASDERGRHPDMSAAGMAEHMKIAKNNDTDCRELREQIVRKTNEIEEYEYDRGLYEIDCKIAVARMHELGGYLEYLAAIKQTNKV